MEKSTCDICEASEHRECCICFRSVCCMIIKDLCADCAQKVNGIHPVTHVPLPLCICGKIWNIQCRFDSVTASLVFIDPDPYTCTPQQNLANAKNPKYWVPLSEKHGHSLKK
jgi:hypothetical protein